MIQVNRIYLIFNLVHFLVDSSELDNILCSHRMLTFLLHHNTNIPTPHRACDNS